MLISIESYLLRCYLNGLAYKVQERNYECQIFSNIFSNTVYLLLQLFVLNFIFVLTQELKAKCNSTIRKYFARKNKNWEVMHLNIVGGKRINNICRMAKITLKQISVWNFGMKNKRKSVFAAEFFILMNNNYKLGRGDAQNTPLLCFLAHGWKNKQKTALQFMSRLCAHPNNTGLPRTFSTLQFSCV